MMYHGNEEKNKHKRFEILVAEDNEMNRKVILKLLKLKEVEVEVAVNGLEAVEAVKRKDFDLVFMDCQMPVMDGYESTARIRALEGNKSKITIIAMTAHALEGDRETCIQSGMDDYISKPLDFSQVYERLEYYMQLKETSQRHAFKQILSDSIQKFMTATGLPEGDAHELFQGYEIELPKYINQISLYLENEDCRSIKGIAHQLKGSSGSLRVTPIYEISLTLEAAAEAMDLELLQSAHKHLIALTQA